MKRVYWRPHKCSSKTIFVIGVCAVLGMVLVEALTVAEHDPFKTEKYAAAHLTFRGMETLRNERLERGYPINPDLDPTGSGLVGETKTSITTISGGLRSKQSSINPNWGAAIVDMLTKAGVRSGDCVAVGYTGSYPCVNVAVCAALESLNVKPLVIASATSSQYGANLPNFMWVDMEQSLHAHGLINFRSIACSIGGMEDRGVGLPAEVREKIIDAIERSELPLFDSESYDESLDKRMKIYEQYADGSTIKAYINVGGGAVSVGRALGKKMYADGLNLQPPPGATEVDSVMSRFARRGVPVIHLAHIADTAKLCGFPVAPTQMPTIGDGNVYARREYNRWLAGGVLLAILFSLRTFVTSATGSWLLALLPFRRLATSDISSPSKQPTPELMV